MEINVPMGRDTSALNPALSPRRGGIAVSLSTISAGFHNWARKIRFVGRGNGPPTYRATNASRSWNVAALQNRLRREKRQQHRQAPLERAVGP